MKASRVRTDAGRSRSALRIALACALAIAVSAIGCGCAWVGSALEIMGGTESAAPTAFVEPAASAGPEETREPAPVNPVFALFTDYFSALETAKAGMLEAAAESSDPLVAEAYMRFCACEAELAMLYPTVGLMSNDGSGWAGSFTGNWAGSGSMNSRGIFEYLFEDGRVLAGRAGSDMAEFGIGSEGESVIVSEAAPEETPEASEEPTGEPTVEPEETKSSEPTPEPTPEPTEEPIAGRFDPPDWRELAGSDLNGSSYAALLRTDDGFIGVVLNSEGLGIIELNGGRIYYALDARDAVINGLDPFEGIAGLDGPPCAILEYERGELTLERL